MSLCCAQTFPHVHDCPIGKRLIDLWTLCADGNIEALIAADTESHYCKSELQLFRSKSLIVANGEAVFAWLLWRLEYIKSAVVPDGMGSLIREIRGSILKSSMVHFPCVPELIQRKLVGAKDLDSMKAILSFVCVDLSDLRNNHVLADAFITEGVSSKCLWLFDTVYSSKAQKQDLMDHLSHVDLS